MYFHSVSKSWGIHDKNDSHLSFSSGSFESKASLWCFTRWVNPELFYSGDFSLGFLTWELNQLYSQWWHPLESRNILGSELLRKNTVDIWLGRDDFSCLFYLGLLPLNKKWYLVVPSPLSTTRPVNLIEDFRFYMQSVQVARCHMLLISDPMKARSYSWKWLKRKACSFV